MEEKKKTHGGARVGAGRKIKGEQKRSKTLSLNLSEIELSKIKSCSEKLGVSRTDAIIKGIELLLEKL